MAVGEILNNHEPKLFYAPNIDEFITIWYLYMHVFIPYEPYEQNWEYDVLVGKNINKIISNPCVM